MARNSDLELASDSIWATEDLMRIGSKVQEFAADHFSDSRQQQALRSRLSRTIHQFEEETGLTIL